MVSLYTVLVTHSTTACHSIIGHPAARPFAPAAVRTGRDHSPTVLYLSIHSVA